MSYYQAARTSGQCEPAAREEDDYLYDAPHCSSKGPCPAQKTSYDAIVHAVHASHLTPDAWESRWLEISVAA